ncbi:hypothetical protein BpHYR1_040999, partial [Brachionus plicatilis]
AKPLTFNVRFFSKSLQYKCHNLQNDLARIKKQFCGLIKIRKLRNTIQFLKKIILFHHEDFINTKQIYCLTREKKNAILNEFLDENDSKL